MNLVFIISNWPYGYTLIRTDGSSAVVETIMDYTPTHWREKQNKEVLKHYNQWHSKNIS